MSDVDELLRLIAPPKDSEDARSDDRDAAEGIIFVRPLKNSLDTGSTPIETYTSF